MNFPTVLILTLPNARELQGYLMSLIAREWEARGLRVLIHHDLDTVLPADICFVHVDRSVVPPEYTEFARRYPASINLSITDIRKRSYSRNRVVAGDDYDGPVIVKSTLNYAGEPERDGDPHFWQKFRGRLHREFTRLVPPIIPFQQPSISSKKHYRIFPSRRMLPVGWLERADIVVERFRPERHGDLFVLREWYFLGDRESYRCETSTDPIFTSGTSCPELATPPPDAIRRVRTELRLDYGKIDYAIDREGNPVLFDVNKTIGVARPDSLSARQNARTLADGLAYYLEHRTDWRSA